jgi:sugar/nucleoside kinase (ribokinase family)
MIKHAADCARLNVPFMFDPGQQLPMFSGEELIKFIDEASYVAANDYEFEMLMDRTGLTLPQIAERLEALIVTRGEKGSEIYAKGERFEIPCVPAAAVVDPTGCGDAFRAGLLHGITNCWAQSRSRTRADRTTRSRPPRSPTALKRRSDTATKHHHLRDGKSCLHELDAAANPCIEGPQASPSLALAPHRREA